MFAMIRRIAILTKAGVKFYDLKNEDRPLTLIGQRLYRTDEKFMIVNATEAEEFVMYDVDSTYPYCVVEPPAPDETMAYIDVFKGEGKKPGKGFVRPKWLNFKTFIWILLGAMLAYYFVVMVLPKYMG